MNSYRLPIQYNLLGAIFLFFCFIVFLSYLYKMAYLISINKVFIVLSDIFNETPKKEVGLDRYYEIIKDSELYIDIVPINFVLAVVFISILIKVVQRFSIGKKKLLVSNVKSNDLAEFEEKVLKEVGFDSVKYHLEKTLLKGSVVFVSIKDLSKYINGNESVFFKLYHELTHYKVKDESLGYMLLVFNQVLSMLLCVVWGYILTLLISEFYIYTGIFDREVSGFVDFVIFVVVLYAMIRLLKFNKIPSRYKECLCDRYASMSMSDNGKEYSNEIFEMSESVNHPSFEDRVNCTKSLYVYKEKLFLYYGALLLLLLFPSFVNNDDVHFFSVGFLVFLYIVIFETVSRIDRGNQKIRKASWLILLFPFLIYLKFKLCSFLVFNILDYPGYFSSENSKWIMLIQEDINNTFFMTAFLMWGYFIYGKITRVF